LNSQSIQKNYFLFTTTTKTQPHSHWYSMGIVKYEEVQNSDGLRFILIKTEKPKRANQISHIIRTLGITKHEMPDEPDGIVTFTKKKPMNENKHVKWMKSMRSSDTYISWDGTWEVSESSQYSDFSD
jgi:hypothetical protein